MGQRMPAVLIEARSQAQHLVLGEARRGHGAVESRLAFGQGSVLGNDQRIDLAKVLDRRGVAEQHALCCRLAGSDHDGHRRRQAQGARASDDQHGHCIDQAVDPTGFMDGGRPEQPPTQESQQRDPDDCHDEVAGHPVSHALHWRPGALRLQDHLHDAGQHRAGPDLLGAHGQCTGRVVGCTDQHVADALDHRVRYASQQGFIHGAAAFDHNAVDRHGFPGVHAQRVTHMHMGLENVLLVTIRFEPVCRPGRQPQQRCDRRMSLRARLEFKNLAKQSERDDHRGNLEIDSDLAFLDK